MTRDKHTDNPFALSLRNKYPSAAAPLVPFRNGSRLTKREQWVRNEVRIQATQIEAATRKVEFGMACISDVNVFGTATFLHGMESMLDMRDRNGRSRDAQRYMEQFTELQVANFGRQIIEATNIGATAIAHTMYAALEPPEMRSGFMRRLFGREE